MVLLPNLKHSEEPGLQIQHSESNQARQPVQPWHEAAHLQPERSGVAEHWLASHRARDQVLPKQEAINVVADVLLHTILHGGVRSRP